MRRKKRKPIPKAEIITRACEKRVAYLDKVAPFTICFICGRENRNNILVSAIHYRCDSCAPMSANWQDYWRTIPAHQRPEGVNFLLKYCKEKHEETNICESGSEVSQESDTVNEEERDRRQPRPRGRPRKRHESTQKQRLQKNKRRQRE